MWEDLTEMAVF
jgi:ubiquitin-activating enzyme E1